MIRAIFVIGFVFGIPVASAQGNPITITGNSIQIEQDSKFLQQLQIAAVTSPPGEQHKLKTVGQMIAIANPPGSLTKNEVSWLTLDLSPDNSQNMANSIPHAIQRLFGLKLPANAPIGLAYGVTQVNNEIHVGEQAQVNRYGLRQITTTATVVSVLANNVIFSIADGRDWYPGTNCEIEFPLISKQAVSLSPLSMLHEGIREYVLKELAPNQFVPEEIVVLNETNDQVYALGNLVPGDRVIERGAILLKPVMHQFLERTPRLSGVNATTRELRNVH